MKKIIIITVLFTVISCIQKKKQPKKDDSLTVVTVPIKARKVKDEVVIIMRDSIDELPLNIISEKYQIRPDILFVGKKYKNDTLIVPTDSILKIYTGFKHFFGSKVSFNKGDTVQIELKKMFFDNNEFFYPYFKTSNSVANLKEINFDYYVNKKTPTTTTYKIYNIFSGRRKKSERFTTEDVYQNTIRTNDSLYHQQSISEKFHQQKRAEADAFKAYFTLKEALKQDSTLKFEDYDIDIVDNSNSPYKSSSHFSYLKSRLVYENFKGRGPRVSDVELLKFVLNDSSKISFEVKPQFIDHLLYSIGEISRTKLPLGVKMLQEAESYPSIYKKYQKILDYEREGLEKMRLAEINTGKLLSSTENKILTFAEVLHSLKGNIVLIDFWASWCAPCRLQMPAIRKITEKYQDAPLVVVSVSIDKNEKSWKKASLQERLWEKKHNYILLNSEKSKLLKTYNIESIPRYLIFDKDGNLLSDDAPSPDTQELNNLLKELLTKNAA